MSTLVSLSLERTECQQTPAHLGSTLVSIPGMGLSQGVKSHHDGQMLSVGVLDTNRSGTLGTTLQRPRRTPGLLLSNAGPAFPGEPEILVVDPGLEFKGILRGHGRTQRHCSLTYGRPFTLAERPHRRSRRKTGTTIQNPDAPGQTFNSPRMRNLWTGVCCSAKTLQQPLRF